MDRRESLKSLLVGSFAGGTLLQGCTSPVAEPGTPQEEPETQGYGRTEKEKIRDEKVKSGQFFTEHELETMAVICDIILPATDQYGSATDAEVPEFIEFIAKDMPNHQLPLRGGIMWLDHEANKAYNKTFKACTEEEQKALCDLIAYPDRAKPEMKQGVKFFSLVRNLTLTGYYTTKMGIEELGYQGNTPNVWDGVPEEVLKKHGMSYEEEWLARCIDQEKRTNIAQWDEEGNLIG